MSLHDYTLRADTSKIVEAIPFGESHEYTLYIRFDETESLYYGIAKCKTYILYTTPACKDTASVHFLLNKWLIRQEELFRDMSASIVKDHMLMDMHEGKLEYTWL